MLNVTRKGDEKLYIGNDICLTVAHIGFDWLQLVIEMSGQLFYLYQNANQSFEIGNTIRVKILEINRGKVRLGIDAPREISIERDNLVGRVNNWSAVAPFYTMGKKVLD